LTAIRVGVAAFQGDVEEHLSACRIALGRLGIGGEALPVKLPEDIEALDALIIPGGESTVIGRLASHSGAIAEIKRRIREGLPVMGTCAGLIMLARRVYDRVVGETGQPSIGALDIVVERNAYGRQRESFEAVIELPKLGIKDFKAVFIRAPSIVETGENVEVLGILGDRPVAVEQGAIIGTTFHPELSGSTIFHEMLIKNALTYSKI